MKSAQNSNIFILSMSLEIEGTCHKRHILSKLKYCENYWILSKLSISSNILIFIDLLPAPCNASEKRDQNSKKITWSFDNFVKLFQYWSNFIVLTTWMVWMNSEWLELPIVQGRFPVSFEKREIRFVFQLFQKVWKTVELDLWFDFFRHSQNVLGGLSVSLEKN
jgi:hypothetical protein